MENYFDTAPCCYFSFSDGGELLVVNQTICSLLGYNKNELIGGKVAMIFPVPTRIFYQTHFFPLLKMHGHAEEIFIFLLAKNGEQLPVLMNADRRDFNGNVTNNCACIVVQNRKKFEDELINARKNAEASLLENAALKIAKEALTRQAEKMDEQIQLVKKRNHELKQLNRALTHDLQEPLRKMLFFINLLGDQPDVDLKQKEKLQKLVKVVNQLQTTIAGLQQYVWLNEASLKPVPVDLNMVIKKVRSQLADEFKEDLLVIKLKKLPGLMADSQQIYLLFYHILNNTIQYRKPGEKATVTISATVLKKNRFKEVAGRYQYQDFLKIVIKDEGIGFDPTYKNQVFDMFKKLHHLDRRGLGLSFCKLIVENHGGSIDAESKPIEGTGISILFPRRIFSVENTLAPESTTGA